MCAKRVPSKDSDASVLWDIARAFADDSFHGELHAKVLGSIRARNVSALCSLDLPDPKYYSREFVHLRQLQAFFKKNAWFSDDKVCSNAAKESFLSAEKLCRITNKRLDYYYLKRDRLDPDLKLWLERCERFIRTVLGDLNNFIDQIPGLVKITGGATEDRARSRALPYLKISRTIRAPSRALPLVDAYLRFVGNQRPLRMHAVDTNRVELVPKNYKTHRTIACEPTAALPFQLAFDTYVKRRMVRHGCDLSTQSTNQELARAGSIFGKFATIDLSMASDTISYNAVAWLLPPEWFSFCDRLRAKHYKGSVGHGKYAKFSSMGNGMTFALETLIFLSCIRAVGSKEGTTYGDDIIVETEYVPNLLKLLRFLGFRVNQDKSFVDGPFRESCGADWLEGRLVTPFYIRKLPRSRSERSHVVNGLAKIALPYGKLWHLLRFLSKDLPLVPESQDTGTGVHISYRRAQDLGLIVSHSKAYGPYVPVVRQLVESSDLREKANTQSYLLFLLFGGRVSCGVHKQPGGSVKVIEPNSLTMWNIGQPRRRLTTAPVRPWSSNFSAMDLWEAFLTERPLK